MKLYIKQKVFSWNDKFSVKDENGEDRYFVEGEVFSLGKKLHIYDRSGNEMAFIKQKVLSFMPTFTVYIGEREIAEIRKNFTLFNQKYTIDGLGWEVNGGFLAHDYVITDGLREIVEIHKAWMTWGDCYELDIAHPGDEIAALAVVLAIDCAMEKK